jgi:hypothetical protein
VNDLLLRDLFVILGNWNRSRPPGNPAAPLRVAVPINLRPPEGPLRSASFNTMTMGCLDRDPRALAERGRLLDGIRAETRAAKRGRWGFTLGWLLRLFGAVPGGLATLFNGRRNLGTAMLPFRRPDGRLAARGAVLEGIEFFPPVRPLTRASFGALSYAGRLTLGLTYDPRTLTAADGRRLFGAFLAQVDQPTEHTP